MIKNVIISGLIIVTLILTISNISVRSKYIPPKVLSYKQLKGLQKIAYGFSDISDYKTALKYADQIKSDPFKYECYGYILSDMSKKGNIDLAFKKAKLLENNIQERLHTEIVKAYILGNPDFDKAVEYINQYYDKSDKDILYKKLYKKLLANNKLSETIVLYKSANHNGKLTRSLKSIFINHFLNSNLGMKINRILGFFKLLEIPFDYQCEKLLIKNAIDSNHSQLIMDRLENLEEKDKASYLKLIAKRYIRGHRTGMVKEIIPLLNSEKDKDQLHYDLISHYTTKTFLLGKAMAHADSISDSELKMKGYRKIVNCNSHRLNIDKVIDYCKTVPQDDDKKTTKLYNDVTRYLFKRNLVSKFEGFMNTITVDAQKDVVYCNLIKYLLKESRNEEVDKYMNLIKSDLYKDIAKELVAKKSLQDKTI